jgi:hypothetical protein
LDFLDGIERIPQFVVRPSFVDEILAGVARLVPCPFRLCIEGPRGALAWALLAYKMRKLRSYNRSDIPRETYPFVSCSALFVSKLRTSGWSLPPAHTQRFPNLHQ